MTFYRERLWPALWIYLALALVIPASLLVFLPINVGVGIATAIILYAAMVALAVITSPIIEVTGEHLKAGRARLPLSFTGETTTYTGGDAVLQRGQKLDARAWLLIRGWIDPIIKIEVTDPADPTPYWIVSTRHPADLAAAITTARSDKGSRPHTPDK